MVVLPGCEEHPSRELQILSPSVVWLLPTALHEPPLPRSRTSHLLNPLVSFLPHVPASHCCIGLAHACLLAFSPLVPPHLRFSTHPRPLWASSTIALSHIPQDSQGPFMFSLCLRRDLQRSVISPQPPPPCVCVCVCVYVCGVCVCVVCVYVWWAWGG